MAWWPSSIGLPSVAPAIQVEKQLESFWAVGHLKGGKICISIQAELMAWSSKKGSRQENNEGIELVISRFNLKKGPEALWRWDDGHTMADEYSLRIKWGWDWSWQNPVMELELLGGRAHVMKSWVKLAGVVVLELYFGHFHSGRKDDETPSNISLYPLGALGVSISWNPCIHALIPALDQTKQIIHSQDIASLLSQRRTHI